MSCDVVRIQKLLEANWTFVIALALGKELNIEHELFLLIRFAYCVTFHVSCHLGSVDGLKSANLKQQRR